MRSPRRRPTAREEAEQALAAVLADEASRASAQTDHAVAARLFGRAAALAPDRRTRQRWLLDSGVSAMLLGDAAAERLLAEAASGPDVDVRALARGHLATQAAYSGRAPAVHRAPQLPDDPVEAVALRATRWFVVWEGDAFTRDIDALVAGEGVPSSHHHACALVAVRDALDGRESAAATDALVAGFLADPDARRATPVGVCLLVLRRPLAAAEVLACALPIARAHGDLPSVAWVLSTQAWACAATGELNAAVDVGEAALALGGPAVGPFLEGITHAQLALAHALLGDDARSTRHATAAHDDVPEGLGTHIAWGFAVHARGLLDLGHGRYAQAARHLHELRQRAAAAGPLALLVHQAGFDLVEARWGAGDAAGAREGAAAAAQEAAERPLLAAQAASCAAVVADDSAVEEAASRACELLAAVPDPVTAARVDLLLGERLRRARRPADARVPLRRSYEAFATRSMTPWAERAARELAAAGAPVEPGHDRLAALTAQERAVAHLLARGATTAEAATALAISPRTVETHLTRVYRKLGVNRRAALAVALRASDGQA